MPKSCCAVNCHNHNMMKDRKVSFFTFPKDSDRREKWIIAVNRVNPDGSKWQPSKETVLCADHFISGKPNSDSSHPDFIPSKFVYNKTTTKIQGRKIQGSQIQTGVFPTTMSRESPDDDDVMIIDDDDYMDEHFETTKDEKEKISSGNRCSNPLHNKWGNNDKNLKMASKLSNAVITIFRHLGYERSSGCMFCETCVNKATEVAEMDKSQGTSAIMVSDDSNDRSDSRSSSASRARLTRKQSEQAQIQAQLDRLATMDIDEDEKASRVKQLRMLAFVNPGKFMENFDPENSAREMKKMNRRILKEKTARKNQLYDDTGRLLANNKDLCDCLDVDCPGCHFPCPRCRSEKCGGECRCNRRWVYDHIEIEGTDTTLSWDFPIKPPEGQ